VISPLKPRESRLPSFRTKLLVAMMLVVTGVTALGLLFAQHKVAANVKNNLQSAFQSQLDALHVAQEVRSAALAELSRALARRSRIHAALEDNALDLRDDFGDVVRHEQNSQARLSEFAHRFAELHLRGDVERVAWLVEE